MATTQDFAVSLGKSLSRTTPYWDDPFTIQNGHYVGHDGFIVPNSFTEFYERFPRYVANWVAAKTRGSLTRSEAEDWTPELLLFLASLPLKSVHRTSGKQDVIQTFAPERMHGANEARFRSYINRCLSNRFKTLYRAWRQRPLSNSSSLSFDVEWDSGAADEFCHVNSTYLRSRERRNRERDEQRLRLGEFVCLANSSIPGLSRFIEVFSTTGSWEETARLLGRQRCAVIRRTAYQLAIRMAKTSRLPRQVETHFRPVLGTRILTHF